MNHLKINLEFRDLIPPLTHDEYSRLEQNLIQEGCRDAIKTWRGTILDGHNRYEICTKHGLKYDNMPMSFSSRNDAKGWIIDNQLGRRNLPDAAYIELAIQKMELGRYKNPNTGNKRKIIAQLSGKSESNVHRYMKIRKLGNAELVKAVKHGEIKIGEAYKNLEACKYVEITTKTELCPGWVPKMKSEFIVRGIMWNIKQLTAMYGFLIDNFGVVCDEDDGAVCRGYRVQLDDVVSLMNIASHPSH